ncbi:DUF2635 domain-containing protein [Vibrio clamense]|uniref:DUF2635 domain-containing protein n=1 Tax=Vibrio clamense TaxID=2910254 RepID=UPI003D1B4539
MQTFKIKPKTKGLLVKDPETFKPLKATGEEKPRNAYWLRRLSAGDVVEIKPNTTPKKETK